MLPFIVFFFQAEDGIRDLVRSRGLGDVYKRQVLVRGNLADQPLWRPGTRYETLHPIPAWLASKDLSLIHI